MAIPLPFWLPESLLTEPTLPLSPEYILVSCLLSSELLLVEVEVQPVSLSSDLDVLVPLPIAFSLYPFELPHQLSSESESILSLCSQVFDLP